MLRIQKTRRARERTTTVPDAELIRAHQMDMTVALDFYSRIVIRDESEIVRRARADPRVV